MITSKPDIITILEKEGIALKQRDKEFWSLCPLPGLYNSNTPVNILDYVNAQRQLRVMMFSRRGGAK